MNEHDTDPQELVETAEMLDGLVEKPDQWDSPLDKWFKTNIIDLLDRTKV